MVALAHRRPRDAVCPVPGRQSRWHEVLRPVWRAACLGLPVVWRDKPARQPVLRPVRNTIGHGPPAAVGLPRGLHPQASRREDPHVEDRSRRRALLRRGNLSEAIPPLERSVELCRATPAPDLFDVSAAHLGYAYALSQRLSEGRALLEEALANPAATGVA